MIFVDLRSHVDQGFAQVDRRFTEVDRGFIQMRAMLDASAAGQPDDRAPRRDDWLMSSRTTGPHSHNGNSGHEFGATSRVRGVISSVDDASRKPHGRGPIGQLRGRRCR